MMPMVELNELGISGFAISVVEDREGGTTEDEGQG